MNISDASLRFEDVTFSYPDAESPALKDVSLEITPGTFALVTGATGAGKSTLLRCANGLVPHFTGGTFSGRVFAGGRDTLDAAPRDLADVVAFVPQDPAASFVLDRVEDELAYGMENLAVPAQQMRRRVEETLDLLALEGQRNRSVRTLSGGERQRVAIGAALAAGPRILVLDEPTSQLDPQGAEDVLAALQRLVHDHGMTVLIAEHRLERVAGFVDLAIACEDGVVTAGDPAAVISRLHNGPPVTRLGAILGWSPPPLTVRDARALATAAAAPHLLPAGGAPHDEGEELLSAKGLAAGYSDDSQERVLDGLDLAVCTGEIIAIMGRNGAGKTTLLRCLAGVHEPSAGSVIATRTGETPQPGTDTALCPQEPENVLFKDTVELEVRATVDAREGNNSAAGAAAETAEVLDALAIEDLATRHPHDLSAGQRLLVATAAIVATGAPVLLLDEPTRGLDPEAKQRLSAFLRAHAEHDGAAVFATHDVELAAALATRVVMLAGGEMIADGTPAAVLGDSHVFAPQMTRVFGPGWLTPDQVAKAMAV